MPMPSTRQPPAISTSEKNRLSPDTAWIASEKRRPRPVAFMAAIMIPTAATATMMVEAERAPLTIMRHSGLGLFSNCGCSTTPSTAAVISAQKPACAGLLPCTINRMIRPRGTTKARHNSFSCRLSGSTSMALAAFMPSRLASVEMNTNRLA